MGKFEGILFVTDLDGTLLREDKTISQENLRAIEHFQKEGGYFTFITGRMPFFCHKIHQTIKPNAPIGCINGGGIYDYESQDYIWKQELSRDVLELVEYADQKVDGIGIQVNTFSKVYFCKENAEMARFRAITGIPNLTLPYHQITEPFAKILFGDKNIDHIERLTQILKDHPRSHEFDFIRSELTLYEILPKNIGKGNVLPLLAKHLSQSPLKTIAIGDYNNDVHMLRVADLGVAVANATEEAKQAADHITVSNEEHAIARIIADLENGTLKL